MSRVPRLVPGRGTARRVLTLFAGVTALVSGCSVDADSPVRTVVFIGDSYAATRDDTTRKWPDLIASWEGWRQRNLAWGGTGYLTTGDARGCGMEFCPNYGQVVPEAVQAQPDVVMVSGGRNDVDQYDHADSAQRERAAIDAVFAALRTGLPAQKIYAVSPIWDANPAPPGLATMSHDVQAAVTAAGGTYLDIGQPLSGRSDLLLADGVHPNRRGQEAIAKAVLASLGRARRSAGG